LSSVAVLAVCLARPDVRAQDPPGQPEKVFYSSQDRLRALDTAALFTPRAVADADIVVGPPQQADKFQLHLNDRVTCEFDTPGDQKNGKTPKFDCRITRVESADGTVQTLTDGINEEPVKVKFGRDNRETYSEVASTRLLWALGFYADAMYPVRLICLNCPPNPQHATGDRATRTFNEAVIERKFPFRRMYEQKRGEDQGWSWKEFEGVERPSYQKDGLKLIAAFLIHSDNKPEQQRLVCDGVTVDKNGNSFKTTCRESKVLIQDVGATFGGGGAFTNGTTAKMNLKEWSGKSMWKKVGSGQPGNTECQAVLPKSWAASDGLGDPRISEEGRRFAAGLLCQLSDAQIENVFKTARVTELPDYRNSDGTLKSGQDEAGIVRQWVAAFKQKREALAAGRCRWKTPPSDLKEIDNPLGLPTVPNFCSARPF
jgi:hypothetical protein